MNLSIADIQRGLREKTFSDSKLAHRQQGAGEYRL